MSFFIIERGPDKGRRIAASEFPIVIGRSVDSPVILSDKEISRQHFRIKKRDKLYIIEDLGSRNGTYVNGERIVNSLLKNGDKILAGHTEIRFMFSQINIDLKPKNEDFFVTERLDPNSFKLLRLSHKHFYKESFKNNPIKNAIYEDLDNLSLTSSLSDFYGYLLKSIGKYDEGLKASCLFTWHAENKELRPYARKNYRTKAKKISVDKTIFDSVISRGQAVLASSEKISKFVFPLKRSNELYAIVQLEIERKIDLESDNFLSSIYDLCSKACAYLEAISLRGDIDILSSSMVETVLATIDAKDTYTKGHSERVSRYSLAIAEELKLNLETKKQLMMSSLVHDVGKIGIPDNILKKASTLTAEEYEEMKHHPEIGEQIISHLPHAKRILSGVLHHHEKWDGTGYPHGLVGEEIPFFARIIAISDVFDAIVSGRSYSGFMTEAHAAEIIDGEDVFDPEIVKAFLKAYESGRLTLKTSTKNIKVPA